MRYFFRATLLLCRDKTGLLPLVSMGILWLFAETVCVAQQPEPQEQSQAPRPAPVHALPAGVQIDGISIYGGGDWLRGQSAFAASQVWMLTSGATADIYWRLARRRREFTISYHVGYNRNERFTALTGFNHLVSLHFRTNPASRTVFELTATGETGLLNDALFDPSYLLTSARQASTIAELAAGLNGGMTTELGSAPLDLALGGIRRKSGVLRVGITRSHSRRLTSFLRVGAVRELRSYSQQQAGGRYPNLTVGMADLGVTYSLSTRTHITGALSYTRSYTRPTCIDWQSATGTIDRLIGRRFFASFGGGYSRISDGGGGFGRSSYSLSGALGAIRGAHTFSLTARRGVADVHGLGADYTIGSGAAWSWSPHASNWSSGASLGYERLEGHTTGLTRAWLAQAEIARRLSVHFRFSLSAVYLSDSGQDLGSLDRRGVRLSLTWTPAPEHTR